MTKPKALYCEIDPYCQEWIKNLIQRGLVCPGDVVGDILDITPADLRHYNQFHAFAGIGVWSYALRRAGWSDDANVWTGSCPCQPFSAAGKGGGFDDERHLWPHFHYLIEQCRPAVVLGEQVASKDGLAWLDLVQSDLEGSGYAAGAVDACSAGFGAPHIRQRLYWMAYAANARQQRRRTSEASDAGAPPRFEPERLCDARVMADADGARSASRLPAPGHGQEGNTGEPNDRGGQLCGPEGSFNAARSGPTNGFWRDADWLLCRDGKWRPVEPGTFPLAHGAPARVGRLRAYGNAINAEQATAFCEAALEACQ